MEGWPATVTVAFFHVTGESKHYLYLIRLVGFAIIIAAIVDNGTV